MTKEYWVSEHTFKEHREETFMKVPGEPADLKPGQAFQFWAYEGETPEELREEHERRLRDAR